MHTDTLINVYSAKFSKNGLADAQSLMYRLVKAPMMQQKRKGDAKKNKAMCDIIKWSHMCDDDDLHQPVYDNVKLILSDDIHGVDVNMLLKPHEIWKHTCQGNPSAACQSMF